MAKGFRVKWDGLDEFRANLRSLPEQLTADAESVVRTYAQQAEAAIRQKYPERGIVRRYNQSEYVTTGKLRDSLKLTYRMSKTKIRHRLTNKAFYAHMYESGTRYAAPQHVFWPTMNIYRRRMYEALKQRFPQFNLRARGDFDV